MTALVIVDSPEAAARARAECSSVNLATDNPMLAYAEGIENLDALVDQSLANELGLVALALAEAVDPVLADAVDIARPEGVTALSTTRAVRVLAASLLYRASVLSKVLAGHACDRIEFLVAGAWGDCANAGLDPGRFSHPFPALASAGFLGNRRHDARIVPAALPKAVNDTASDSLLARLALLPPRVVTHLLVDRARRTLGTGSDAVKLPVVGDSEILREAATELRRAGFRPVPYKSVSQAAKPKSPAILDTAHLGPALDGILARGLEPLGDAFQEHEIEAIQAVLRTAILSGAPWMSAAIGAGESYADRVFSECDAPAAVLTSAMSHITCAAFHRRAASLGMRVLLAEHGVSKGLAAISDSTKSGSEINHCDTFLAISRRAASGIAAAGGVEGRDFVVVGLPDQVRRLQNSTLQRRIARRRLRLAAHTPVIFHVSPLPFYGNQRPGHFVASETTVFNVERIFLEEIYPATGKRVLFKSYPTQRLPFHPPLAQLVPRAANIDRVGGEDFRYLRAAADIIVTGTPTSTLGWCLGAGVPVIWWYSRLVSPPVCEAIPELEDAFLCVDIDRPDWGSALASLLARPIAEITSLWEAKRPARERLLADAIFGPPGVPGARVAEAVANVFAADRSASAGRAA
jgi:hypothetical protein